MTIQTVTVVGGGLAGSEAAWQLAERGIKVCLYEMRPIKKTGAHVSNQLGELVCSNSLGSKLPDRATGLLQHEMKLLGSKLLEIAESCAVPAGGALAVDREAFSERVTQLIEAHPNIEVIRQEIEAIPDAPAIIATGPLTSDTLSKSIATLTGKDYLYFYDAISPIVTAESINMDIAFHGNRYDRGETEEGDYINCPMDKEQYLQFVKALQEAETAELRDFEKEDPNFFEGCVPIEQLAKRGEHTLSYGPMRPVGITDPRAGRRPYAVVQLRRDNLAGNLYNIVGFQTNIRWGAQTDILKLIPGLEDAEFIRLGQMHRNTFINSPTQLDATMKFIQRPALYFAGQITGIEGYIGNMATGLLAAINLHRELNGQSEWVLPTTTMLGALCHYISHAEANNFQPMKANFGILPDFEEKIKNKRARYEAYSNRALSDLSEQIKTMDDPFIQLTAIIEE